MGKRKPSVKVLGKPVQLACDVCLKKAPLPDLVPGPEGMVRAEIARGWQEFLLAGEHRGRAYANTRVLVCPSCKGRVARGEGPIRTFAGGQAKEPEWADA